jgi:hypothetical protein
LYVEDLKLGSNKDIGPKDIFEIGSKWLWDSIFKSPDPTCQTRKNGFERGEKKKAPFTEERLHVSIYNFAD